MHFLKTSTLLAIVAASVPHLVSAAPAVAPPAVKKRAAEDILVFSEWRSSALRHPHLMLL